MPVTPEVAGPRPQVGPHERAQPARPARKRSTHEEERARGEGQDRAHVPQGGEGEVSLVEEKAQHLRVHASSRLWTAKFPFPSENDHCSNDQARTNGGHRQPGRVALGTAQRDQSTPYVGRPEQRTAAALPMQRTARANMVRTSACPRASTRGSLPQVRSLRFAAVSWSRRPGRARASLPCPRMVRRGSTVRVRQRASGEKKSPCSGFLLPSAAPQSPPHDRWRRY
jgi:hypothetical protein